MSLDPPTLAAAFVLLSTILGGLLLFAWTHNRKVRALAWWGATFCLIPAGIGLANLGQAPPSQLNLFVANALVTLGYSALCGGCRAFNGRTHSLSVVILGPAIWVAIFPFIRETFSARLVLVSLIAGGYAALAARELRQHASRRLASQRAAIILLVILAAFNFFRGMLGLSLGSIFGLDAFANRWSVEMALFLVIYAPALAFIFLSMAKEHIEWDYRTAEQALRESEEHYRYSVELNPQIPWTADLHANITTASPRWEQLTGLPVAAALGTGWAMALHPDDRDYAQQRWFHSTFTCEPFDSEYRLRQSNGDYRWFRARAAARFNADGTVLRWYGTLEDIHDRRVAEEHLRWAAYHDELTGLPNRRMFQECLRDALGGSASPRRVGLLILDLDHLKQINDTSGHDAGDALLKEFGLRLRRLVGTADTVARLSGDEFAVILPDVAGEEDVAATARAILARMREPLVHHGKDLDCRTSIGGAISAGHGTDPEELLKQADLALYSGKAAGRGRFAMFQAAMRDEAQKRASSLEVARQAVALDWIEPFYQPKIDLRTGKLAGFEALLRWRHPRLGIQSPGALAQAFEDPDLGIALGERMLSRVVEDLRRWLEADPNFARISINASAAEFRRSDYAERVLGHLREAGIPPDRIGVEVTETVLLDHNDENVRKTLCALREGGISIALDDFGTGYASLSHLKQFPVDVIKIDRSFVSDLTTNVGDAAIVKAVLSLGQSLGIRVVAEGVETAAQASFLREHGCDLGQGYLFGRPMPAGDIPQFVVNRQEMTSHADTGRI